MRDELGKSFVLVQQYNLKTVKPCEENSAVPEIYEK